MQPQTVHVFLVDGSPTGLLIADIPYFGGKVLVMPRARISELSKRPEAGKTGIYCLLGSDEENPERDVIYIGETDNVLRRLLQHDKGDKDYWTRAAFIVSSDEYLTKAHVKYLESKLIQLAQSAGRARVMNDTAPPLPPLPESDVASMGHFLAQLELELSVLGLTFLRQRPQVVSQVSEKEHAAGDLSKGESPLFQLRQLPALATGKEIDGEFIVFKGSRARAQGVESWTAYRGLRDQLIRDGKLVGTDDPSVLEFAEDIAFKSPSAAAAVTLARNANGRTEWKLSGNGQTFQQWNDLRHNVLKEVD